MFSIPRHEIATVRLTLLPTTVSDADRAFEIQSDWQVSRMLSMASFPPDPSDLRGWFGEHTREWMAGDAYRFAIKVHGRMIGLVDIDDVTPESASLGYWLERDAWGQGYAFEAAQAMLSFAFGEVGVAELVAGHAEDNQASGRVLLKLGFIPRDSVHRFSKSRGQSILQRRYTLASPCVGDRHFEPSDD